MRLLNLMFLSCNNVNNSRIDLILNPEILISTIVTLRENLVDRQGYPVVSDLTFFKAGLDVLDAAVDCATMRGLEELLAIEDYHLIM